MTDKIKEIIDRVIAFLKGAMSNDSSISSMRFAFIYSYVLLITALVLVWAIVSLYEMRLADIPGNLWLFVSSILAIITGGKLWQNVSEGKQVPR